MLEECQMLQPEQMNDQLQTPTTQRQIYISKLQSHMSEIDTDHDD